MDKSITIKGIAKIPDSTCISKTGKRRKSSPNSGGQNAGFGGGSLDTLAQLGTNAQNSAENEDFDLSASTAKDDRKSLLKRARRKYMTNSYLGALIDACKRNEDSSLHKSYWNSYHCARVLTLRSDGLLSGRYCKNRWCLVCNSIRTAQLINRYRPELESWPDKHFATATIPNVPADQLAAALEEMYALFAKVKDRLKKRHQRGQAPKFVGIRKMECTYNPGRNDFHPHFHFIFEQQWTAEQFIELWVSAWNASFMSAVWGAASPKAQDVRAADDKSTLELFKYFTKVVQKPNKDGKRLIYADAMDIIFNAVKGKRVFQNFGFKAPALLNDSEAATDEEVYAVMEYTWNKNDWEADQLAVDYETGEVYERTEKLTGYEPSEKVKEMAGSVVYRKGHTWEKSEASAPVSPVRIDVIRLRKEEGRKASRRSAEQLQIFSK